MVGDAHALRPCFDRGCGTIHHCGLRFQLPCRDGTMGGEQVSTPYQHALEDIHSPAMNIFEYLEIGRGCSGGNK
jgi:hypothetical protein